MYNHLEIEKKWQEYWEKNETFKTDVWDFSRPKFYALDMFPYPSGVGLHAGHPEGYTATDVVARMKKMQGYNVLHPMGYDSFGLPAEQYAIKTGNNPAIFTEENGAYSVLFPDLEGCYTCGDDLKDAFEMAEDVLAFTLYHYESKGLSLPAPSAVGSIKTKENEGFLERLLLYCRRQNLHKNKGNHI